MWPWFYGLLIVFGVFGTLGLWIWQPWPIAASFACGVIIVGLMVWSWAHALKMSLNPESPNKGLGIALILVRYSLLGVVIYSMMALFVVRWAYFALGLTLLLPCLVGAHFLAQRQIQS
jgi:hypothetical protein